MTVSLLLTHIVQARVVNESGLQMMSSNNLNIAFDNRFVARTALPPVSPGQSFDVLFGIDHGVQVCMSYYALLMFSY
jgi:hypothetical protein